MIKFIVAAILISICSLANAIPVCQTVGDVQYCRDEYGHVTQTNIQQFQNQTINRYSNGNFSIVQPSGNNTRVIHNSDGSVTVCKITGGYQVCR